MENLNQLVALVMKFLHDKDHDTLAASLQPIAKQNDLEFRSVEEAAYTLEGILKEAVESKLSKKEVVNKFTSKYGFTAMAASMLGEEYQLQLKPVLSSVFNNGLSLNGFANLDWKLGVSVASKQSMSAPSPFVQLRIGVEKGNSAIEYHAIEMSIPQFYHLLAEMEIAKRHMTQDKL